MKNNFMFNKDQKIVYAFIDASNLWQAQKVKGRMFDFEKLKPFLKIKFNASELQIFYYTLLELTFELSELSHNRHHNIQTRGQNFRA